MSLQASPKQGSFLNDYCSNGSYCYFEPTANADSFSCDDECAVEFYTAAHDYSASAKEFNYYWLISRGSWWADEFATGWTRLTEVCGVAGDNSTTSSNSTETSTGTTTEVTTAILGTEISTVPVSSAAENLSGTATSSASSATSTSTSTSKSSPTASTNAVAALEARDVISGAFLGLIYACLFV